MRETAIEQGLFEVLAIGIGATAALFGACAGLLDVRAGDLSDVPSSISVIVLLAFSYALGIAVDRLANRLMEPVSSLVLRRAGMSRPSTEQVAKARNQMSDDDRERGSYARTRLRIVRGWAIVLPACAVSLTIYLVLANEPILNRARIVGVVWATIGLLTWLMVFAFADITRSIHSALHQAAATESNAPLPAASGQSVT